MSLISAGSISLDSTFKGKKIQQDKILNSTYIMACVDSHCCSSFNPGLPPRLFLLTISLTFTRGIFIYVFL
jgi:hypothetical protein